MNPILGLAIIAVCTNVILLVIAYFVCKIEQNTRGKRK